MAKDLILKILKSRWYYIIDFTPIDEPTLFKLLNFALIYHGNVFSQIYCTPMNA